MRPRDDAVMAVVLAEAVAAAGGDPEAAGLFVVAELLEELADCYQRLVISGWDALRMLCGRCARPWPWGGRGHRTGGVGWRRS